MNDILCINASTCLRSMFHSPQTVAAHISKEMICISLMHSKRVIFLPFIYSVKCLSNIYIFQILKVISHGNYRYNLKIIILSRNALYIFHGAGLPWGFIVSVKVLAYQEHGFATYVYTLDLFSQKHFFITVEGNAGLRGDDLYG